MDGAKQSRFRQIQGSFDEIDSATKQGFSSDQLINGGSGFCSDEPGNEIVADFSVDKGGYEVDEKIDLLLKELDLGILLELKKKKLLGETYLEDLVEGEDSKGSLNGSVEGSAQSVDDDTEKSWREVKGLELNGGGNVGNGIQVIDETTLVKSVFVDSNGIESGTDLGILGSGEDVAWRGLRDANQEFGGKKAKRSRRQGKSRKKVLQDSESCNWTHLTPAEMGCQRNGEETKIMYSREEIETQRFVGIVDQQQLWKEVYNGLGPDVAKEYDDLGSVRHQKQFGLEFDPRQRFAKKEKANEVLGGISSESMDNDIENVKHNGIDLVNTLDPVCSEMVGGEDGYTDIEEECVEDYDSEEDYASIQKPAFMVDGEPNFDSGPVEDGFEYLRRVRWEAAHIPKVKVAKLDRSKLNKEQSVYMPQIEDIATCPENLLPLKQWEEAFLADFSKLRLALSHLVDSDVKTPETSQQLPDNVILESNHPTSNEAHPPPDRPSSPPEEDTNALPSADESSANYPKLSAILEMEPVARVSSLRKRIRATDTMTALSREDCLWLFALCAAIDTPLDADTCAALRSLLRKCAGLRSAKTEQDDELMMLNILISVSGRFFGQLE